MKKRVVYFAVLILMFSIISLNGFVLAEDDFLDPRLNACRDECKALYPEDETNRGMCISGCKDKFGFADEDPKPGINPFKEFDNCDDYCRDFITRAMPACPGKLDVSGTYPECDCWTCDEDETIYEGYEDEELKVGAGTKPGSTFYFIDKFFDRFGDDIKVKEERIAEIKAMVEVGDLEAAEIALKDYMKRADELEHEIEPERKEDAKRSAAAIRNTMKDIRDKLPAGERGDFVSDIMSKEHSIATAAEIASKIKELCMQLAELDPMEYSRMCKVDDEGPRWQKKLHGELTKEQEKVARNFVQIMKECFKTSGENCRCEDIPFPDFADACSQAAPLAVACDIEENERACEKLEELEMPELPEWLEPIWEELEMGMMEEQYKMHMPKECVEAGVTSPKECGRVMIETGAPEECKQALLDSGCDNERECREICDKIMMEIHSPECAEKGITDPKECAKMMMPPECREKELSPRECREYMDSRRHEHFGPGPGFGRDCGKIEEPMERLECYDEVSSQTMSSHGGFDDANYDGPCMTEADWKAKKEECRRMYGEHAGDEPIYGDSGDGYECTIDAKCIDFSQGKMDYEEIKQKEEECKRSCESQDKAWDFSYGECKCYGGDYPQPGEGDSEPICGDCESKCGDLSGQRLSGTSCGPSGCECYYEDIEQDYIEPPPTDTGELYTAPSEPTEPTTEPTPDEPDAGTDAGITGESIFWDYYTN
jgi:hypothetical protein